jgi:hypothetical protein
MALGLEELLATWAGIPRFLSDNEVITGIGTLTGSVLTLVLAPFGLLVVGIAAFRSRLLSRSGRLSAVALGPCLILAALISDAASPLRSPQPGCRFSVSAGSCSAAASCAVPASHSYLERITPVSRRWPTVAASATVTTTQPTTRGRRWLRFAGHFVLMLAAMYVGMLTLYPAYNFLAGRLGYVNPISELPILSALVMALAMTLPMVALMRHQRHGWRPITEMAAAMVIPTLAASLCYLIGVIPAPAVMSVSHSTMIPAMLAVMLLRFDHYAGENHIRPK